MDKVYNPVLPYSGWINNGAFYPGRMIRFQGSLPPNGRGFTINLQTGPNGGNGDVGLHCNLRLPQRSLVLNSKHLGNWGREEPHENAAFIPGQPFEIIILSQAHTYNIAVNGRHFAEFSHRVQVDRILFMFVEGDVTLSVLAFEGAGTGGPGAGVGGDYAPPPSAPLHAPSAPPIGFVDPTYGVPPPPLYPQLSGYGGYNSGLGGGNAGHYPPPPAGASAPPGYYAPPPAHPPSQYPPQSPYAPPPPPHHSPYYPPPSGAGAAGGSGYPGHPSSAPSNHDGGHKKEGMSLKAKLGAAAAVGAGGLLAVKVLKGKKSKKLLKFGIPLAGVGLGGYALKKGLEHKK